MLPVFACVSTSAHLYPFSHMNTGAFKENLNNQAQIFSTIVVLTRTSQPEALCWRRAPRRGRREQLCAEKGPHAEIQFSLQREEEQMRLLSVLIRV